jgi:hypothetical protein
MLNRWDWGDRYTVGGFAADLALFGALLVTGTVVWWLPVVGIVASIAGYAMRQRPWQGKAGSAF